MAILAELDDSLLQVDCELLVQAAELIGTENAKETVEAALRRVIVQERQAPSLMDVLLRCTDWDVAQHLDEILWGEQPSRDT